MDKLEFLLDGHPGGGAVATLLSHPHLPILISGSGYVGGDCAVRVWDLETRTLLRKLESHRSTVWGLSLSPDGKRLASASFDGSVCIWDLETGERQLKLEYTDSYSIFSVVWNASGTRLAVCSSDKVYIYDTTIKAKGIHRPIRYWKASVGTLRTIASHPTEDRIATGCVSRETKVSLSNPSFSGGVSGTISIWSWKGELIRKLDGHKQQVCALVPNGVFLASVSNDKTVRIWSWTGECIRVLDGFGPESSCKYHGCGSGYVGGLNSLAWRDDTLVVIEDAIGSDRKVHVWETSTDKWSYSSGKTGSSCGVAVLEDGSVVCGATKSMGEEKIAVWKTK
jgi:WD40 repeat protein